MPRIGRIPSSIRIRRTESELQRGGFHPSADPYTGQSTNATPTRQPEIYVTGADLDRSPRTRDSNHGNQVATSRSRDNEAENDDDILREEMNAARRVIRKQHTQQDREKRVESASPESLDDDDDDFPAIRLSDEQQAPRAPPRDSSRRLGAVENLALRHRSLRRSQRRQRRRSAQASPTASTADSEPSDTEFRSSADEWRRRSSAPSVHGASHPPAQRNLSDVQEETSSRRTPSATAPPTPSGQLPAPGLSYPPDANNVATPASGNSDRPPLHRGRRNTVSEGGLLATSRQMFGSFMRRNSDRDTRQELPSDTEDSDPNASGRNYGRSNDDTPGTSASESSDMHEDEVVDYLDVVDPEIATVTALQNVGNSIFFPPIPMLYNRRPTISLPKAVQQQRRGSRATIVTPQAEPTQQDIEMGLADTSQTTEGDGAPGIPGKPPAFSGIRRMASYVPGMRKKQVPETTEEERRRHIREWAEMDAEERNELDEHVHMLLSKKAKLKRGAKGFWRYVQTPHGLIITLYGFSVAFWGTAICLFLLRWINVGDPARQRYWIEICDQILCALFAAVGLGFAPFRAVDTYRMVQIAHYHFLTYKRRKLLNLPELKDKNELPRATPRLAMGQMANTMMIRTGLRKEPTLTASPAAEEGGVGADGQTATEGWSTGSGAFVNNTDNQDPSSTNLLQAQTSRRSEEVENLKQQYHKEGRHPHLPHFLHRKHHKYDKDGSDGDEHDNGKEGESQSDKEHDVSKPKKAHVVPKTYANKDGIMPLGQLKRNPSIASELPRDAEDVVVLTPKQQANLEYQQRKFHQSHTFYRYRETVTHRPFELSLMMAIVILLDCHSCLQASLGGTTWGIYYKDRPTSVTATIITFSLSCNAVAGLLIWYGGSRTKKKDEVERLLRIALEEEALRKMNKKHEKERVQRFQERQKQRRSDEQSRSSREDDRDPAMTRPTDSNTSQPGQATAPASAPVQQTPTLECIQEH